jgi:NADP-dependent 3-hydroxy acid dehydrogenase YdfG
MTLKDKVVIITGASSGIGAAIAELLAQDGAKLVLTGRNDERLQAVVDRLNVPVHSVIADVTQKADCERVVTETVDRFGTVDVLVNNAGFGPPAPLLETTEDIWDITLDTCLKGVYLMTQAAVRVMLENGGGSVVQISSVAGKNGYANRTAYCAAKWGVQGFTAALRDELGDQGIRAHTINPGAVATPWWATGNDAQSDDVMDKMIRPEEVAEAVRYVLTQPERIMIEEVVIQTNGSPWDGA